MSLNNTNAWNYWQGAWVPGNPGIMGPLDHGSWLGSTVFDGARAFEGVTPDLDLHCQRLINSAHAMGLTPLHSAEELYELCQQGVAKFPHDAELYIKPMYWATTGFVAPDRDATAFCLTVSESPLPADTGFSVCLSQFRRPTPETALTNAKAACLYPNSGRALTEAQQKGFDNAVMLDTLSHVAELATANIWMAKDGIAYTPIANGTFLSGITRARVLQLLRNAGIEAVEKSLSYTDFLEADELFSTGNFGKVQSITKIESRDLQPGPVYTQARQLYWQWAHQSNPAS